MNEQFDGLVSLTDCMCVGTSMCAFASIRTVLVEAAAASATAVNERTFSGGTRRKKKARETPKRREGQRRAGILICERID